MNETQDVRVYTSQQLVLERDMTQMGESRFRSNMAKARERNTMATTSPGRTLLRAFVFPVADCVEHWLERKKLDTTRLSDAAQTAIRLGSKPCALMAVQEVINGIHQTRPATKLCHAIGSACEDEWRFRELARNNPGIWREAQKLTKHSSPKMKRRIAVTLGNRHGGIPRAWGLSERVRLGMVLLDAVIECTELIEMRMLRWGTKGRKKTWIIFPTEKTISWLEKAEDEAARSCPVYMPMLDEPAPWEGIVGGGYLTDLVLQRPIARFRCGAHQKLVAASPDDYVQARGALNALQRTQWEVSGEVLETLETFWNTGSGRAGLPEREPISLPQKPVGIDQDEHAIRLWRRDRREVHQMNASRASKRTLISMCRLLANRMSDEKFYFPYRMDFRGRCYPVNYYLSPQGQDLDRGLLKFAKAEPVQHDFAAGEWLKIHGSNVWGFKGTLQERSERCSQILVSMASRVAQDPINCKEWEQADKPWQFLAWCFEFDEIDNGQQTTSLPIGVDASNNGLQLYALMSGDRELAKWTNAIGNDQSRPLDMYVRIADQVSQRLADEKEKGNRFAAMWIELLPDGQVPRECSKRPTMTLGYGVTEWSAQNYVAEWYRDEWGASGPLFGDANQACTLLSRLLMQEIKQTCTGAVAVMDWLRNLATTVSKKDILLKWTSPSGWPVMQHYRKPIISQVKAKLGGSLRKLSVRVGSGDIHTAEHRQGLPPNFTHSIDAAILAQTVSEWDGPIATVHDCYVTTAPRMQELVKRLGNSVASIALESEPLNTLRREVMEYARVEIPAPPSFGEISPDEVRNSEYLFS